MAKLMADLIAMTVVLLRALKLVQVLTLELLVKKGRQMVSPMEKLLAKMIELLMMEDLILLAQDFVMVVLRLMGGNLIYQ